VAPQPGQPILVTFPLRATSALIPAGWSLRLSLSGADFPLVWPPKERFTLTVDPRRSQLVLPIVASRPYSRLLDLPAAPEPPPAPVEDIRSNSEWTITTDGGVSLYRMIRGGTERQPDLTYTTDQWWTVSVRDDDPATTQAQTVSIASLERPGWAVTTEGTIHIDGGDDFEVTIELTAKHNGKEVFRRSWRDSIPRQWA
jgi:hypothetical protein